MKQRYFYYSLGDFEIFPHSLEIKKRKDVYKVQKKAMQVMLLLLENSGRVVTKDEVARSVWGKTIVSENSLMKIISELRKILSDAKDSPNYIETVPTVGYRLLKKPVKKDLSFGSGKSRRVLLALLFLLFAAFSIFLTWTFTGQNNASLSVVSPNGELLLKADGKGDSLMVSIHDIQKDSLIRFFQIKYPMGMALQWAPDNNRIVFNATLAEDNVYTICVYNINIDHYMYVRFAKPGFDLTESTATIDSVKEFVMHKEIGGGEIRVEYLQVSDQDTVKMLMEGINIVGFEW